MLGLLVLFIAKMQVRWFSYIGCRNFSNAPRSNRLSLQNTDLNFFCDAWLYIDRRRQTTYLIPSLQTTRVAFRLTLGSMNSSSTNDMGVRITSVHITTLLSWFLTGFDLIVKIRSSTSRSRQFNRSHSIILSHLNSGRAKKKIIPPATCLFCLTACSLPLRSSDPNIQTNMSSGTAIVLLQAIRLPHQCSLLEFGK